MTQTTSPGTARPLAVDRRADLRGLEQTLDDAYERARAVGYRAGSPEMHALNWAESRYRQAKGH